MDIIEKIASRSSGHIDSNFNEYNSGNYGGDIPLY